jgi:hypothetical protein
MKISKDKANFNTYKAELTYGELITIRNAMQHHTGQGPEADEILSGLQWYLEKMPEPGEEPEGSGESNTPNMAKTAADDALDGLVLDPPPGEESEPSQGGEAGEESNNDGPEPRDEPPSKGSNDSDEEDEDTVLPEPPKE